MNGKAYVGIYIVSSSRWSNDRILKKLRLNEKVASKFVYFNNKKMFREEKDISEFKDSSSMKKFCLEKINQEEENLQKKADEKKQMRMKNKLFDVEKALKNKKQKLN